MSDFKIIQIVVEHCDSARLIKPDESDGFLFIDGADNTKSTFNMRTEVSWEMTYTVLSDNDPFVTTDNNNYYTDNDGAYNCKGVTFAIDRVFKNNYIIPESVYSTFLSLNDGVEPDDIVRVTSFDNISVGSAYLIEILTTVVESGETLIYDLDLIASDCESISYTYEGPIFFDVFGGTVCNSNPDC